MATTKITVPDYEFSGFYYAEILRRLRIFNRVNAPEITAEVAEEPFIQLERAFALVGHLNNVLLDLTANEVLLPTLKLQDSARNLLKLIDFELRDFSPSTVELLIELPQALATSQTILEANTLFETERTEESPAIPFENVDTALTIGPTNIVDGAFGLELNRQGTDGVTVLGTANLFESATAVFTQADVGRILEVTNSILGNNGVYRIADVETAQRVQLTGVIGSDDPLFIAETGLTWAVRAFSLNGAGSINTVGAPNFSPIVSANPGDAIYFGSLYVMPSELEFVLSGAAAGITGIWEYYDPDLSDETPDLVINNGTNLTFSLNSHLGTDDASGAFILVTYLPTGQSELLLSTFSGGTNQITTSAFLGQSGTPSTDVDDYSVGSSWNPFPNLTDNTTDLQLDAKVEFDLPQSIRSNWQKVTIQNLNCFWFRYRIVALTTPTEPEIDTLSITSGKQFILVDATQGETVENEALQSSNGLQNQEFALSQKPGLRSTVKAFVDEGGGEVEWTNLTATNDSLLTSSSKDRHFVVDQNSSGELTVRFGDGTRGKIPPLGVDTIRFQYRIKATEQGNVGANTITNNAEGAAFVSKVFNPRPAFGWREADGASDTSLALVKEEGPASLRTLRRAVSPADFEDLAINFQTSAGTRPIVRAKSVEEGFGPKTIKLVVVGVSGAQISNTVKTDLEKFFNGSDADGIEGAGLANTEVTVQNFTPRLIDLTVVIEANAALTDTLVRTALTSLLSPTALESDGTTFVWRFGGRVPLSRVASEIFTISPGNVFDVDVTSPSVDIELSDDELPLLNASTLTISIVAPTT